MNRKTFADFFRNRLSDNPARYLWVILSVFSLFGIIEIPYSTTLQQPQWLLYIYIVVIALFKGFVLTALIMAASPKKWLLSVVWLLTGLYMLFCLINFLSFVLYGFGITHRLITILSQTNLREIREFTQDLCYQIFSAKFILCTGGSAVLIWMVCMFLRTIRRCLYLGILYTTSVVGLLILILCFASFNSRAALIMGIRIPKNIVNTINENREYQKILDSKRPLPYADKVESTHQPLTIVMIVGESAHRRHLQLYGYPLPTTPQLWSMRDSLFVFKDAIASSQSTAGNLERILSLKTDDETCGDWYKSPLVYDIFNAAGFKTFWLSNQERKGIVSDASGVMADGADVVNYVSIESSEDAYAYRYDDVLLPYVKEALDDKAEAKFIGIHLLGSHSDYRNRYPKDEEIFTSEDILRQLPRPWLDKKKAAIVAQYDNSIHFTDKLLGEILKQCSAMPTPAILLYFSDHGEMVYDTDDFKGRNSQCVEVPFMVYANYSFRIKHEDKIHKLSHAIALPISTATIPFALLTLADIRYPLYDAANDFLSGRYKIRARMVDEKIWIYETVEIKKRDSRQTIKNFTIDN